MERATAWPSFGPGLAVPWSRLRSASCWSRRGLRAWPGVSFGPLATLVASTTSCGCRERTYGAASSGFPDGDRCSPGEGYARRRCRQPLDGTSSSATSSSSDGSGTTRHPIASLASRCRPRLPRSSQIHAEQQGRRSFLTSVGTGDRSGRRVRRSSRIGKDDEPPSASNRARVARRGHRHGSAPATSSRVTRSARCSRERASRRAGRVAQTASSPG